MNRLSIALLLLGTASQFAIAYDGLAAKYQKDAGIANDKAVLFHDDFEGEKISGLGTRWSVGRAAESQKIQLNRPFPIVILSGFIVSH